MGKMAEMQRKLLEVRAALLLLSLSSAHLVRPLHVSCMASADGQTMMGPEAMGIQILNLDWWDDRVCRNFLFGTCPHLIFGNTVRSITTRSSPGPALTAENGPRPMPQDAL